MASVHHGLSPSCLLLLLCLTAILLFGDRGCVSSNSVNGARTSKSLPGYGIQGDFDLSLFQDGLVAAALMVGLMCSAPLSAILSKRVNSMRLIGGGLACWVVGTAASGLAPSFPLLLLARTLVGTGSGPFIAVAAPLIDDVAPRQQKSLWLAALFLCFPTGFAVGYIYGGLAGTAWGWRTAFLGECAAMSPLALLCLLGPAVDIKRQHNSPSASPLQPRKALAVFWGDLTALCSHPTCPLTIAAMSLYSAALGGFAYYGPKAARDVFHLDPQTGDLLFGAITVATGVLGTLSGGLALDCAGSSVRSALLLCALGTGAGCLLVLLGFALAHSLPQFGLAFGVGEYCMFIMAAPSAAVLLWSVPSDLRPFALSIAEVMQHLAGDIPSPPLLGWLQGSVGNWRLTMSVCSCFLGGGAALFGLARCWASSAYRGEDPVPLSSDDEEGGWAQRQDKEGATGLQAGSGVLGAGDWEEGQGAGRQGSWEQSHGTAGSSSRGDDSLQEPLLGAG